MNDFEILHRWIAEADRILIGAGAGLSVAAGFDYGDQRRFAELFPDPLRTGRPGPPRARRPTEAR